MRAVVQRCLSASVEVDNKIVGKIGSGILVFLSVEKDDTSADAAYIIEKATCMRIFDDSGGKMNLSVKDVAGEILLVSEFTLCGDIRKGKRPNFGASMGFADAERMYNDVTCELEKLGFAVQTGVFGAMMKVDISNDGPVTILLDSKKMF